MDIKDDLFMVLVLTAKVLEFNFQSFFSDSRWTSLFKAAGEDTQEQNA